MPDRNPALSPAPLKVLFYTHALAGGGAERVWALLATGFAQRGYDVILAVDYEAGENQHLIDPRVRVVMLGGSHAASIWRLSRLIARERPDVSLSALSASNVKHTVAAALAGRLDHAVLSYHGYADSEPQTLAQIGFRGASILTRLTAATVGVSDGLVHHMHTRWGGRRLVRIYNPVAFGGAAAAPDRDTLAARAPNVLAAGRLVGYKNFLSLVRAFARVNYPGAHLTILGEGPERPALEHEIAALGQTDRITLRGYVNEPWALFMQARCFVLPSRTESFGLVLVEALAAGLPVVSSRCHGPLEILDGGRYGTLVPIDDETALADAVTAALTEPGDPAPRRQRATAYSVDRGVEAYEALIAAVSRSGRRPLATGDATGAPRRDDGQTAAPIAGRPTTAR